MPKGTNEKENLDFSGVLWKKESGIRKADVVPCGIFAGKMGSEGPIDTPNAER